MLAFVLFPFDPLPLLDLFTFHFTVIIGRQFGRYDMQQHTKGNEILLSYSIVATVGGR